MGRHLFIALEGLSGTGKTTVARLVAKALGGEYMSTPPQPLREARDLIDSHCSHQARYFFYLAGVVHASTVIREVLRIRSVVCDRYFLTTECFHKAIDVQTRIDPRKLRIVAPDLTVLLTACEKILKQRLDERGRTLLDTLEDGVVARALLQAYREWNLPEIDTTEMAPEEVASEVLRLAMDKDPKMYLGAFYNR